MPEYHPIAGAAKFLEQPVLQLVKLFDLGNCPLAKNMKLK